LTAARARTGRQTALESIDTQLLAIMIDLSARVPGALQKTGVVTVLTNTYSIALPTDCIAVKAAADPNGAGLEKAQGGIDEVMTLLGVDNTANTTLEKWAVFEKKIYVFPKSSGGHALTLYYQYEDNNIAAITFDDCCKEALIEGVCHKVELGFGVLGQVPEKAVTHGNFYEKEVASLQARYAHRN